MDWSPSVASRLEALADAEARRALSDYVSRAPLLSEFNQRERVRYCDKLLAEYAEAHGISVADAYDIFLELVLDGVRARVGAGES